MQELIRQTERLDRSMNNQEAQESPKFTATPEGNTAPVADSNGALAIGWLQVKQSIAVGETVTIHSGYSLIVKGPFTVDGTLTVNGDLVVM